MKDLRITGRRLVVLALAVVAWIFVSGVRERWRAGRDASNALSPLHSADREDLVRALVTPLDVAEAARSFVKERKVSEQAALETAERYAREILPNLIPSLHSRFAMPVAGCLIRAMYRIDDEEPTLYEAKDSAVVLMMGHRSNLDYVVLAGLFDDRVLSFAAGEWASGRLLGPFVRALGSYFVRRDSGNVLYRRVLARFVELSVQERLTQVIFPEGGLSRDGLPREPKIGLLDYLLRSFDPDSGPDIVFVPVAAGYDRILEDRSMTDIAKRGGGPPSRGWLARSLGSFALGNARLFLHGGRKVFGRAVVNTGPPLSSRGYAAARGIDFRALGREERIGEARRLARELMRRIQTLTPVLSVPLVAHVILEASREALSEHDLKERVGALISKLQARDAHIPVPQPNLATEEGLRMLLLRGLVTKNGKSYHAKPEDFAVLRYYANALVPLLDPNFRDDRGQ